MAPFVGDKYLAAWPVTNFVHMHNWMSDHPLTQFIPMEIAPLEGKLQTTKAGRRAG